MRGSRRRFIRRAVAFGWFAAMMLGGLYLSTAWLPDIIHRARQVLDLETLASVTKGVTIGVGMAAVVIMTSWSWRQLRNGGLARLFAFLRNRD